MHHQISMTGRGAPLRHALMVCPFLWHCICLLPYCYSGHVPPSLPAVLLYSVSLPFPDASADRARQLERSKQTPTARGVVAHLHRKGCTVAHLHRKGHMVAHLHGKERVVTHILTGRGAESARLHASTREERKKTLFHPNWCNYLLC